MKPEKSTGASGVDQFTDEPTTDAAALLSDIGEQPADVAPPEPAEPTSEIVRPLVAIAFALSWPDQPLSQPEETAASEAVGKLIDKYFPDLGQSMGVELNAALIVGGLVFGRVMTARENKKALNNSENDDDHSHGEKGKPGNE